jgi:DNA invertase Pin-like site-specific DNA recombinase
MVPVMRAAIYIRLSQETEHTTSPAKQEELCRRYAEDRGWAVVGVYPDIDVSATHTRLDRPELTRLRDHCQAKAVDVVIVWRLDRLARSVLDTLVLLNEWSTAGVATASATENIDLTTPIGRAMVALIAIFAEMEADAIKERQRGSIDQLRRNGRFAGGAVPYGYVPVPRPDGPGRVLVIDEEEAKVIRECVELVRSGHSLGYITRLLNERGVWAPRSEARRLMRAGKDATAADRGRWRVQSVRGLLVSDHLAGRQTHRGQVLRDPDSDLPVVMWPPIIDGAVLAYLKDTLAPDSSAPRGRRVRKARLLSGLARCAVCSSKMYVGSSNGQPCYACTSRRNGANCPSPRVYAESFERYVMTQAIEVLGPRRLTRTMPIANPAAEAKGVSYAELEREVKETTAAMAADDADVPALVARLGQLKAKRAEMKADDVPAVLYVIEETGESWGEAFAVADTDTQRMMLEEDIAAVWVKPSTRPSGYSRLDPDRVAIEWTVDNPEPAVVDVD